MALDFKILLSKKNITDPNDPTGAPMLDLTNTSIRSFENLEISNILMVTEEISMRPDLLSQFSYGTDSATDLILWYNGYSNPFSVEAGDIFVIPDLQDLSNIIGDNNIDYDEKRNLVSIIKENNKSKFNNKDNKRSDYLRRKTKENDPNISANNLPPNFVDDNREPIQLVNGRIVFGNNVAGDCIAANSDTQLKSQIIQKRIQQRFIDKLQGK